MTLFLWERLSVTTDLSAKAYAIWLPVWQLICIHCPHILGIRIQWKPCHVPNEMATLNT